MEKIKIENVSTGAFTMDCFRFGHGKKALVILPGLSVRSVMNFADSVATAYSLLTGDYTVFVFDRRKELPDSYSVYDMARDTAKALETLGLQGASILGASQGGMIAMTMAAKKLYSPEKLILASTSARVMEEGYKTVEKWVQLAKSGNATELYLNFGEAIYPQGIFEMMRELLADDAKNVSREELERFVILSEGMKEFDVTRELDNISCPVLVVGSKDDRVLGPDAAEHIAACLGKTSFELYMYDGYGHAVYDTAPDFKERVLNFLRS